jgi:hypothetical protein
MKTKEDLVIESIDRALQDISALEAHLRALREQVSAGKAGAPAQLKKANGRLTDVGVLEMRKMFEERVPDSEIAKRFDITVPAVLNQKKNWLTSKLPRRRVHWA